MNRAELNWQDLRFFLAVAEAGSFSSAARSLKLGQPTLSRRIADFEEQLGETLFFRNSHGCELTSLGAKLLPSAKQMAIWSTEILTQTQIPEKIEGRVRITAPPSVCFAVLPQVAHKLHSDYPGIQLEVLSNINTLNLALGEAEISVRTALPKDQDLICLASFYSRMKVYVAKDLAKSLSDNVSIHDLNWICWSDDQNHLISNQLLKQEIPNFKPVFSSNDYNVQIAACSAGLGALILPDELANNLPLKNLKPLNIDLNKYSASELHIIVHKRQQYMARVVIVSELLQKHFR